MSQHDYDLANQAGAAFRSDLNNALAAILAINSGSSAPSTTVAGMLWYDTTNAVVKQRNAANSGWVTRWTVANAGGSMAEQNSSSVTITGGAISGVTLAGSTCTLTGALQVGEGYGKKFNKAAANVGSSAAVSFSISIATNANFLPGHLLIHASGADGGSSTAHAAWWLYRMTQTNGSAGVASLADSGGDTADFSVSISGDSGTGTQVWTLTVTATSLDRVVADVEAYTYGGVTTIS